MKGKAIRLTESQLRSLIKRTVRRRLNENYGGNTPYGAWSEFLGGRQPLFEFEDGIVYVDYDEENGTLCSGGVTNAGFHKDGDVEVPVEGGDFQSALEEVYDQLSVIHGDGDEMENLSESMMSASAASVPPSGGESIAQALDILLELRRSGYIPFSSPAPSSTEFKIKNAVTNAINLLKDAYRWDRMCYGGRK